MSEQEYTIVLTVEERAMLAAALVMQMKDPKLDVENVVRATVLLSKIMAQ